MIMRGHLTISILRKICMKETQRNDTKEKFTASEASEAERAKQVELYLKQEKQKYLKLLEEPKILILGTSDSGKSTFLKQLKIIHGAGFTDAEIKQAKQSAITQVLNAAEIVIENSDENIKSAYNPIMQYLCLVAGPYDCLPLNIINLLATMWEDPVVQKAFQELNHLIPHSTSHFMMHIKRIAFAESVLTNEDILMQRTVTQSITETTFVAHDSKFHFYDVSGLKHHRKQWIPYFQDILMIIFLVDISAYDKMMAENPETNRMVDALNLFDEISNHKLLKNVDITIFFNKKDLFEHKVTEVAIIDHFPDFKGEPKSAKSGGRYFEDKFVNLRKDKSKFLNTHFTCCTDSKLIKKLSTNLFSSLANKSLAGVGL
ncbi:guanine nucleotide binding protein, alpha subunit [Globomyces pollinis-pini]|nr:guanine nucleotide binding protein, alpha subunit [Globomyces pollinis-pini]